MPLLSVRNTFQSSILAPYAHVEIKPQLGTGDGTDGLTNATGIVPTIRGPVKIDVVNSPTTFKLSVNIPGNMMARVLIPTKGQIGASLNYNGAAMAAPEVDGYLVLEDVPSGDHTIYLAR